MTDYTAIIDREIKRYREDEKPDWKTWIVYHICVVLIIALGTWFFS